MKKVLVALFILAGSACVYADVINPHISPEEYQSLRKLRQESYKIRQRQNYIKNICGIKKDGTVLDKKTINNCKADIKKEFDATIKLVEQIANENKKNAKQETANAAEQ
ncbi:MAG: hypothetical protein K6C94_06690 [Candidatus Gastranaerophilales bacterium]|nr:hypothetical protein [Candidatus Gastranaerophilales bacterium]